MAFVPILSLRSSVTWYSGFTPSSFRSRKHLEWKSRPRRSDRARISPVARVHRGEPQHPVLYDSLHIVPPMNDIDKQPFDFSQLKGKVVFAVNVASQDEFTHDNYTMMQSLLAEFKDSGFAILAFPSNWFGQKETWPNNRIKTYVEEGYSSDITLMDKFDYEMNPVFAIAQEKFPGEIQWNFHGKFLFDRNGLPIARFDLLTSQDDIASSIRDALGSSAPPPKAKDTAVTGKDSSEAGDDSKETGQHGASTVVQEQAFVASAAGAAAASAAASSAAMSSIGSEQELGVDQTEGSE